MSSKDPEKLIARHEAFLECRPVDRPLRGFWVGGYYPGDQFPGGTSPWRNKTVLHPEDVSFAAFAPDYENLYQAHRQADDDFFYVGSAYWGIPWLEAILGCPVTVAAANCRAESCLHGLDSDDQPTLDLDANPWLDALLHFTRDLVEFSGGRFPVCPPLLRGPGDAACAILGGMAFVTAFADAPEQIHGLLDHCLRTRLAVLRRLQTVIPAWHGTHAAGGYPSKIWCRRTVGYYQEDSAALLNPDIFREFLLPAARQMCRMTDVNFIHLHSGCLYPVDIVLEDESFDVVQINIDHPGAGLPLRKLIATFKRIQAAKRPLLLWGELDTGDWDTIGSELSPVGLSLQPIVRSVETIHKQEETIGDELS